MNQIKVTHNREANRFEVKSGEHTAVLEYRTAPDVIVLHETRVPPELEGKGIGSALAKTALEYARAGSLKVIAECHFVAGYIKRHPEYADLVYQ